MNTEDSEFARIEREQAMRNVPDAIHHTDTSESLEYITGWNDCRAAMLAAQPAQQGPVAILDVEFMRQVLSVAITGLYYHYKDDVLKVFSPNDLQNVVDLCESFGSQQVEDIYKRAWDMLATPQAQPTPVQQEPVAWKHDCAALLTNDVELWIGRCPHCGKPRTTPQAPKENT